MFINELKLYVDYLKKEVEDSLKENNEKRKAMLQNFKNNLLKGIEYYHKEIAPQFTQIKEIRQDFVQQLLDYKNRLNLIAVNN